MNFKLFTTALLATGATAAPTTQNAIGDALRGYYQEAPAHIQRRFWVRISLQEWRAD